MEAVTDKVQQLGETVKKVALDEKTAKPKGEKKAKKPKGDGATEGPLEVRIYSQYTKPRY